MGLLKELSTERYDVFERKGITKFIGCQCFKDCTCAEDFKPESYHYYEVKRKRYLHSKQRIKTTIHKTLDEVKIRTDFLDKL